MNANRIESHDDEVYSEYEEKYGDGGFERFNKNETRGKFVLSKGKKKIKPRQEFEPEFA